MKLKKYKPIYFVGNSAISRAIGQILDDYLNLFFTKRTEEKYPNINELLTEVKKYETKNNINS